MLKRKSHFGAVLMIVGGLVAATGELINVQSMNVLSSFWYLSLSLTVVGTFMLLIGLSIVALVSDQIRGFGFVGSNLLIIGGLLLIIGTVALDWIILPFLIHLANTIASVINGSTAGTVDALNTILAKLNGLGGGLLKQLFPSSTLKVPPPFHVDGIELVNKMLSQLHFPTIDKLEWWGHLSLSGGTLTLGCLILGLALPRKYGKPTITSALLIIFAVLNLLCQFFVSPQWLFANITAAVLFLTLAWFGLSTRLAKDTDVAEIMLNLE